MAYSAVHLESTCIRTESSIYAMLNAIVFEWKFDVFIPQCAFKFDFMCSNIFRLRRLWQRFDVVGRLLLVYIIRF